MSKLCQFFRPLLLHTDEASVSRMWRAHRILALIGLVLGLASCGGGKAHPTDNRKFGERVLYDFSGGNDGVGPFGVTFDSKGNPLGLIFDSSGNLYGAAGAGGDANACVYQYPGGQSSRGCGVVFELSPNGRSWTERVLYTFTGGSDGGVPANGVIFDSSGNLYGTALVGGTGYGVAFELIPIS